MEAALAGVSNLIEDSAYRNRESVFKDRLHAGELLAGKLRPVVAEGNVQVLAIPAGGVPVGYVLAKKLNIPFDVVTVRKIQIPWNTEAGFGAVTWDGRPNLNEPLLAQLGLGAEVVEQCISRTRQMVHERNQRLRGGRPFPDLSGRTVILVDDGLASGFSMLAAAESIKTRRPRKIVVAVPTGSAHAIALLTSKVDELVCLNVRSGPVFAVADAYENWYDLSDDEVLEYLRRNWKK
ncbi:MAG: phosphoribosyltransferase family protein [Candidatus Bathyarchaeia archaeon]